MEELYDYSRHKYCITMELTHDDFSCRMMGINIPPDTHKSFFGLKCTSIVYDTTNKIVTARGDLANKAYQDSKGHPEGGIYVRNIFSELIGYSTKPEQTPFNRTAHDAVVLKEAIRVLVNILQRSKKRLKCSNMDFYYALILPASWDYKTREEFFRPLFVKAGLIHGNDGPGRLMFFSKLESIFQNIQMRPDVEENINLRLGDRYVVCTLEYRGRCVLDFQLVSVQYPAFAVAGRKLVPQLLKQLRVEIPYGVKDQLSSVMVYLDNRLGTDLSPEFIYAMFLIFRHNLQRLAHSFTTKRVKKLLSLKLFIHLKSHQLIKTYGLTEKEIRALQSITMEDMLQDLSDTVEKAFEKGINQFLRAASNMKTMQILIFYTNKINTNSESTGLLPLIVKSLESYNEKQNKTSALLANGIVIRLFITGFSTRENANMQLVSNQMEEFNIRRDPIILPNDTTIEQSKSSLKAINFINIDMASTQIKTTFTYLDKDRQVEQTQNIKCNMQPLNSFIIQSELYQRPILHITRSLKVHLENTFGEYLKLYTTYDEQSMMITDKTAESLDQCLQILKMKITSNNYIRIKTSRNRPKEIRKLFVSSNPDLFEQLTASFDMDDLFVSKDELCDSDSESFTTCHPGYMYFFMITYLHCLNKQIVEKLESNVGKNWQANNIWYGVSIDKNLLDTVFGSTKKLEKLFFASGILRKDDELRKAKFCTRGEEILPAIQQKLVGLEFRMKSFFVVAQVSSKHIQLSLHQIVKLSVSGEDAASIVIQDKIIHIDDVYQSLCKSIIKSIQINNFQVDYCTTHKDEEDAQYDFQSFETCTNIYRNLKSCVIKLLRKNKDNLDMNSKIQLNMNNKCACSISIFLRDIIEVGLMSVIENMATNIVTSLTNKSLFGNYVPNYIFVFGDPFNLTYGSNIHIAYAILMKKVIDDDIQMKEKDTKAFALRESIFQLLKRFVPKKKPYLYERFVTGTLCQVSSTTYGLQIEQVKYIFYGTFNQINSHGDIKNTVQDKKAYLVVVQKGKPISTKDFIIHITGGSIQKSGFTVRILRFDSIGSTSPEKDSKTPDKMYHIRVQSEKFSIDKIMVRFEQISNNVSVKVSKGEFVSIEGYFKHPYHNITLNIPEPLTLAYI